ncbi:MAG: hypothetical protein BGN87_03805 [Rhizobiales bacterium 65-79]|jgi:uncharacterized membrane protein|nr:DUF1345 domain-containing protein [Hyphomicrobiales bacterium]OJU04898.1 MAG: hypothetical protein BGN87_03805 [Rhizobiales bacterium 65-79]
MILRKPLGRHIPFYIAAAVGAAALALSLFFTTPLASTVGATVFFIVYIVLVMSEMPLLTADYLKKNARKTDLPVQIIFVVTVAVICVAVYGLFEVVNDSPDPKPSRLAFSLAAIPLGWFTIHLMAALHYAHLYWWPGDQKNGNKRIPHQGLDFPGDTPPSGWDFLYFSTVIGMTAQTADTGLTSTAMRKAVLLHGIVSFFFNTVIVAAAVNAAVAIGK